MKYYDTQYIYLPFIRLLSMIFTPSIDAHKHKK